jgi:uncharacterized membrane protein (DUF485 family)
MSHGPPTEWKKGQSDGFKVKLGLILFGVYTVLYMAFVFLCVLSPRLAAAPVGGLNVAITYGFGLIVVAIALALVYNYVCGRREKTDVPMDKE